MSNKSKVFLGALVIFICGAVSGGFGSAMFAYGVPSFGCHKGHEGRFDHEGHGPDRLAERLTEKLSLTPEQSAQVKQILERSMPEMMKMKDEHFEAKKAFRMKIGDEIRGYLNPEQQQKFDELRAKMQEKMERKRKFWGHGDK